MDLATLQARLLSAIEPHDLLCHPFYRAWSAGTLRREDLQAYAAQYQHQVDALPQLVSRAAALATSADTAHALARNLAEERGQPGTPHTQLWRSFANELGVEGDSLPEPETLESAAALASLTASDELTALAALWAYELQTGRVAKTKREGLVERYGVTSERGLAFFALHEQLDVHHAAELLAAIGRACEGDPARVELACEAAAASAKAQWRFLDGSERTRLCA